jgi:hypothetical protein
MADDNELVQESESQEGQKPEAKAEKPKRDPVAELKSVKDREVAEARKQAKAYERDLAEARAALDEQKAYVQLLKERGELTDDEEARVRALASRESKLSQREQRATEIERTLTVKLLSEKYGVPSDVIEDYDDPRDMQIAALEYAISQKAEPAETQVAVKEPEPQAESEDDDTDLRFDLGAGGRKKISINDIPLGDPRFKEIEAQLKRRSRV